MKVLIAGGAGYIASTVASACLDSGITPVILDNLSTGRAEFTAGRIFYRGDISDATLLSRIFDDHRDIDAAVLSAALVVVSESVASPARYYRENVVKALDFIEGLLLHGCHRVIFSSTASVYDPGPDFSVDESSTFAPLSPYARTKAIVEGMLADIAAATPLRALSLRYFNPIGADPQLRTGLQVAHPTHALGKLIEAKETGCDFHVTGADYPTRDGSGIRDYIHVWDLAQAHVTALARFDSLFAKQKQTSLAINIGTGAGTTVFELLAAFQKVAGLDLPSAVAARRPGDSAGAYTHTARAQEWLGWTAGRSLDDGIRDTLRWFDVRAQKLPDLAASASASQARSAGGDGESQGQDAGRPGVAQQHGADGHRPAGVDLVVD
jgi:UDP-glucose 4-epimerase